MKDENTRLKTEGFAYDLKCDDFYVYHSSKSGSYTQTFS